MGSMEACAPAVLTRSVLTSPVLPRCVPRLPPTLLGGAENREKYLAIGESDRMTMKFVKPR